MADSWTRDQEESGRGLLFGTLALQLDLIDARQLVDACDSWTVARQIPLADWIAQRGRMTIDGRQEVERVLARKTARFRGDLRAGLKEMVDGSWQRSLAAGRNPDVRPALAGLAPANEARFYEQRPTDRWGEDKEHPEEARFPEAPAGEDAGRPLKGGWLGRHRTLLNWVVAVVLVTLVSVAA